MVKLPTMFLHWRFVGSLRQPDEVEVELPVVTVARPPVIRASLAAMVGGAFPASACSTIVGGCGTVAITLVTSSELTLLVELLNGGVVVVAEAALWLVRGPFRSVDLT